MARDEDRNGFPIKAPASCYDLPWVKGTGFAKKTGDATNTGWHPDLGIPKTRQYFGNPGRHDTRAEREAMRSLGNKWRRK